MKQEMSHMWFQHLIKVSIPPSCVGSISQHIRMKYATGALLTWCSVKRMSCCCHSNLWSRTHVSVDSRPRVPHVWLSVVDIGNLLSESRIFISVSLLLPTLYTESQIQLDCHIFWLLTFVCILGDSVLFSHRSLSGSTTVKKKFFYILTFSSIKMGVP